MNFIELFDSISTPPDKEGNTFRVARVPDNPKFRLGCDSDFCPVLLVSVSKQTHGKTQKNFRFKYLQVIQNVECRIIEDSRESFEWFTVVKFTSSEEQLQHYFLRISETLVSSLGVDPSNDSIATAISSFVEVFRFLSEEPIGTAQAIWSELFIIDSSLNTEVILDAWHNSIYDKFDFASGNERIEVKSTSSEDRVHFFSAEQLNPQEGIQVIVASLFSRQSSQGLSLQNLIERIRKKITSQELMIKLDLLVSKTLGNSMEQSLNLKFDYALAKNSLRYYLHQDVARIRSISIPDQVSNVSFKSDLTMVKDIDPSEFSESLIIKYLQR